MKLYEAFFLSFMVSLIAGAVLFLGLPFLWIYIASDVHDSFIESEITFVPFIFYAIYAVIQFFLSSINLMQAIYLERKGSLDIEEGSVLKYFLIAESVLYFTVFFALVAMIRDIDCLPFVSIFSIPYIICCTNSVLIFRYFLKKIVIKVPIGPAIEESTLDSH